MTFSFLAKSKGFGYRDEWLENEIYVKRQFE